MTSVQAKEQVRTAEVACALSLGIDYGMGSPLEQSMYASLVALRLADALRVDTETARTAYYTCLLLHVTCMVDAEFSAGAMPPGATPKHMDPVMFGNPGEQLRAFLRAMGEHTANPAGRILRAAHVMALGLPRRDAHFRAVCEVGPMLSAQLRLPEAVQDGLKMVTERWDGKGVPNRRSATELPLSLRIAHVARDAALQTIARPLDEVGEVIRQRSGRAFDPDVATAFLADPMGMLDRGDAASLWDEAVDGEPKPHLLLTGPEIDEAISAFGHFSDLAAPCLSGHSAGVSDLAARAAKYLGLDDAATTRVRRAGWLHDVGGVTVWADIWSKPGPLTRDEQEQLRLHPYYTQRVLEPSPFLADLDPIASHHHEALDGSGYHRGESGEAIDPLARLLAAADAFHLLIEPRRGHPPMSSAEAARSVRADVAAGKLDAACVAAVLEAAGEPAGDMPRPAGLTPREVEVIALLARGLATKQIARTLGISVKTADHHIQNAYPKMGVSTRPAATLFAMQHGLLPWGKRPMGQDPARS